MTKFLLDYHENYTHLAKVDLLAREMVEDIVQQISRNRNLPDKATQQLEWVGAINELKHEAEEIVLHQIVYQ